MLCKSATTEKSLQEISVHLPPSRAHLLALLLLANTWPEGEQRVDFFVFVFFLNTD